VTLGALAEIYDLQIAPQHAAQSLADYFAEERGRPVRHNDILMLGPIGLLAHRVQDGRVVTIGLQLAEPDADVDVRQLPRLRRLRRRLREAYFAIRGWR
jgi:hypothetical protein